MTTFKKKIEQDLNQRINLEQSRHYDGLQMQKKLVTYQRIAEQVLGDSYLNQEWSSKSKKDTRIHVIGSNGKGSLAFYLAHCADQINGNVGLYTSPHLISPLERISINGNPISAELAYHGLQSIQKGMALSHYKNMSYFETMTLLALFLFKEMNCTLQIFEAGIGGRFDATKILNGDATVMTRIELEHSNILGDRKTTIVNEKIHIMGKASKYFFYYINREIPDFDQLIKKAMPSHIKIYSLDENSLEPTYLQENEKFASLILQKMGIKTKKSKKNPRGRLEKLQIVIGKKEFQKMYLYFDCAHNLPAIIRTLQDFKKIGLPSKESLVIYGQIPNPQPFLDPLRNPQKNIAAIYALDFPKILLLPKEFFTDDSSFLLQEEHSRHIDQQLDQGDKSTVSSLIKTIFLQQILFLANNQKKRHLIFIGSHRLYSLFLLTRSVLTTGSL